MLYFLMLMMAMAQAALVKVDATDDPLLVYINGQYQGMTPVILEFDDGYYKVDFREDEFTGRSMRYSLDVRGQTKGKLTCDWNMDDFRIVWAEDLQRSSDQSASSSSSGSDTRRLAEERMQAELERRRQAEEERRREEEDEDDWQDEGDLEWADEDLTIDQDEDDLDWEEEERLRAQAEADESERRLAEAEESARRRAEAEESARREREEEQADDLATQALRLQEEARQLEAEAKRRSEEARRLAAEDARRKAEEATRRKAEERASREAEAEATRLAEQQRREEEAERKRTEEAERRAAAEEARRQAAEDRQLAEEQRLEEERARKATAEKARKAKFMPFRNEGEAAMKAGDARLALRAYRKAVAAGDTDRDTAVKIRDIEAESGSVRLTVTGFETDQAATVTLDPPQGEPFEADTVYGTRYTFNDVPAGVALDLRAAGVGYEPLETTLDPIRAKRQARLAAELSWLGTATLDLADWPDDVEVTITDLGVKHQPTDQGALQVTAGRLVVALDGPSGKRQFLLTLEADATHTVSIRDELPGAVRLAGVPAGSSIGLASCPDGAKLSTTSVDRDADAQDQDGVAIAEPVLLQNLPPGAYTISVDHPILGTGRVSFQPEPGETTDASLVWESMSKAAAVRQARQDWERRHARSKKMPLATKAAIGTAGASLAVAGVTAARFAGSISDRSSLSDISDGYDQAMADGEYESAWDLFSQQTDMQDSLRSSNTFTVGGLGVTVAGLGISTTLYLRGRAKKNSVEDWDLWSLRGLSSSPEPARPPERDEEPEAVDEPEAEPAEDESPQPDPEDNEFYIGPEDEVEHDFSIDEEEFEMDEPTTDDVPTESSDEEGA